MHKSKNYPKTKFPVKVIREAHDELVKILDSEDKHFSSLTVRGNNETWEFDNDEEFYAGYPKSEQYNFDHILSDKSGRIIVSNSYPYDEARIQIKAPTKIIIDAIFNIFESNLELSKVKDVVRPVKIFIGHGGDRQWRDLKDHLSDKQGYDVVAYEIGPRAGTSVKQVLENMLEASSFALLVMTGEDLDNEGKVHARENVIHEIGLFQGRLGFENAIILKEDGVEEFSNILGINQIRFPQGHIRECFGDVVAEIKDKTNPSANSLQ